MAKKYVAVTGGIGSGKSLVLQFLRELNYPVFSCDELYKQVIHSKEYIQKVADVFPNAVINGEIDRKALSEIVFQDEEQLKKLNAISHPLIMDLLMNNMKASDSDIVFAEVPLLFEGNFENLFHNVIYVSREKQKRIEAIIERDGLSINEIENRISRQFDETSKDGQKQLRSCNAKIIVNNGLKEDLQNEITSYLNTL